MFRLRSDKHMIDEINQNTGCVVRSGTWHHQPFVQKTIGKSLRPIKKKKLLLGKLEKVQTALIPLKCQLCPLELNDKLYAL